MNKSTKLISLSLSIFLVVGLLLSTATSASAATTLSGLLAQGTTTEWTVNGVPVDVVFDGASPTVCKNVSSCAALEAGMLVALVKEDATNIASTIIVYGLAANTTASGTVKAITSTDLTLADDSTYRIGSYTTLPGTGVLVGDTVKVTYKPSADPGTKANFAMVIEVVNSTASHTFEGTITGLDSAKTTWTVTDDQGNVQTFSVSSSLWPAVFGVGDRVKITYTIVNGSNVVSAVQVLETAVPAKNETARCTNDKSNHPALAKLAAELFANSGYATVAALQADLVDYFCKGFGIGEIRLAFRYAAGSAYTPQMLLALRAQGYGWGDLKKLAEGSPASEGSTEDSTSYKQSTSRNQQVNPNKPDKAPKSGRPDNPGNSGKKGKP